MIRKVAIVLLLLPLTLVSCHTYVWQNVSSQMEGTWTLMPVTAGNTIQFTFKGGKMSVTQNGIPVTFEDENGTTTVNQIDYSVKNELTNQFVYIDQYVMPGFGYKSSMFTRTIRWLVVTVKDDELFLESFGEEGLKGEFQLHFFRF